MTKKRCEIERTLINDILNALERKVGKPTRSMRRPLLPAIVEAILCVDAPAARVAAALAHLQKEFVDWNELRVTNTRDIAAAIKGVGDETAKAEALKAILTKVFQDRHELYLDFLADLRDENLVAYMETMPALKVLYRQAILVYALNHQAIVVSEGVVRVLRRVGAVPKQRARADEVAEILVPVVPKRRLLSFSILLGEVAVNFCAERKPLCPQCPLRVLCNGAKTSYRKRTR
ncbi:MAG: hypothetical protein V2A58_01375 [Planctomycetota bacterium]